MGKVNQLAHFCQRHADIRRFFIAQDYCKWIEHAELVGWEWHGYVVLQQQVDEFVHVVRSAKYDAVIFGDGLEAFFDDLLGEKSGC